MNDGVKNKARFITTLPNGSNLYARKNEAGGRTYYSDEVGGSVVVWDTALVDESTLLAAMLIETTFQRRGLIRRQKLQRTWSLEAYADGKALRKIEGRVSRGIHAQTLKGIRKPWVCAKCGKKHPATDAGMHNFGKKRVESYCFVCSQGV